MSLRSKKILALALQDISTTGKNSDHNQELNQVLLDEDINTAGPSRYNEEAHKDEAADEPFGDSSSSFEPSEEDETDSDSSPNRKQSKTTKSVVEVNSLDQKIAKKRNRKPKKELWKRTINKKLRLSGKSIQYEYNLSDDAFLEIDVTHKRKPGKQRNWKSVNLKHKYNARLPVSQKKKQDLVYLLAKKMILVEYSNFIQSIPVAKGAAQLDKEKSDD
ncbi:hypothetical protein ILUMI_08471 [Ignelater luminosus]|uniref:Uncharacterized protein n=1 Tax=Ignelater luminosus TaxID=2038154 RepID=A0A8K0GFD7_IGNLU|nr:hypothetical protein ILUMI_08471 [Ignelater luminosus]